MTERVTLVKTALAAEKLLFHGMEGQETLSQPFLFKLTLVNKVEDPAIDPLKLLGTEMTVQLEQEYSSVDLLKPTPEKRFFNGYVTRVMQDGVRGSYRFYHVELRPWFWLLDKTSDCRVFQNKSVPEIVTEVFSKQGFKDFEKKLGSYKKREYCVQYRETDFAFVSRLLESEGIYYYFRHENQKHTMVLADGSEPHKPLPLYEEIEFNPVKNDPVVTNESAVKVDTLGGRIHTWQAVKELRSGHYALKDYNFKKPGLPLNSVLQPAQAHPKGTFELFDYPGGYEDAKVGDDYAGIRLEEERALFATCHGEGTTHGIAPGFVFSLTKYPDAAQNIKHLTISAHYDFAINPYEVTNTLEHRMFKCSFSTLPAATQYRPARLTPRPTIAGLQTAKVVGEKNEEISTDLYGRVRVQFPWDREGKFDDRSSCLIRVAQAWAGSGWGMQYVPRIGDEVVVSFLEGDPDKPLITGSVYNGKNSPPFDLPGQKETSGVKTKSTKNGGKGYNELSFDDTKGRELITLHAERHMKSTIEGLYRVDVTKGFMLTCGASSIQISPTGIYIKSPLISLSGANLTAMFGAAVNLVGTTLKLLGDTTIPVLHAIPLPPMATAAIPPIAPVPPLFPLK